MAKNKNKKQKKKTGAVSMDISEPTISDFPQAMDTSESGSQTLTSGTSIGKIKKGRPMKRSKNVRKMKAIAKAISKSEKSVEKVLKFESKKVRNKSAKQLYD